MFQTQLFRLENVLFFPPLFRVKFQNSEAVRVKVDVPTDEIFTSDL